MNGVRLRTYYALLLLLLLFYTENRSLAIVCVRYTRRMKWKVKRAIALHVYQCASGGQLMLKVLVRTYAVVSDLQQSNWQQQEPFQFNHQLCELKRPQQQHTPYFQFQRINLIEYKMLKEKKKSRNK